MGPLLVALGHRNPILEEGGPVCVMANKIFHVTCIDFTGRGYRYFGDFNFNVYTVRKINAMDN
jgi:hypothetical protein